MNSVMSRNIGRRTITASLATTVQRTSQELLSHPILMATLQRHTSCSQRVSLSQSNYCSMTRTGSTKRAVRMRNTIYGVSCYDYFLRIRWNDTTCELKGLRWTSDFTNKMRHSTQQSDANTQRDLIQMADTLLDLKRHPIGTYTANEYSKVKIILYYYIHLDKPTCKEAVNQPIDVLVRLAQEVAFIINIHDTSHAAHLIKRELGDDVSSKTIPNTLAVTSKPTTYEWILNANYYNPIFTTWKNISLNAKDYIPGIYKGLDLIQKVQYMSKILPPTIYKVNIITITMILQVVIKQVRRDEAPIICEKLLHVMSQQLQKQKEHASTTNANSVRFKRETNLYEPNMYSYNILLKAWAESRLDSASEKIEMILQEMKDVYNIELGLVSYKILLRFYSRMGDVDNVNVILQQMHIKKLPIDVDCLTQALNCCCRAAQMDNASTILNMIIHQHPNNAERAKAIQESIHHMLMAYRNRLDTALAAEAPIQKAGDSDLNTPSPPDAAPQMNMEDQSSATVEVIQRPMIAEIIQDTIQRLLDLTNVIKTNNVLNQHSLGKMTQLIVVQTFLFLRSGFTHRFFSLSVVRMACRLHVPDDVGPLYSSQLTHKC